jgi:citryl-CoA lyase
MSTETATAYWTTNVADVEPSDVFVRGYSVNEIIGRLPYSAATYLLVRGEMPTPSQARMIEALLCSILDYSLYKPGTVAARYAVSGNPNMQAGIAVAALSVGEYTLAPEDAGTFIIESFTEFQKSGEDRDAFAARYVADYAAAGNRVPGFGHPNFKFVDPRSQRLKEIAQREGVWGEVADWYEAIHRAFTELKSKPEIPINDVGMTAAILAQLGFSPAEMTGIALLSSFPGVIAHVSEELQSKVRIRIMPDDVSHYPRDRRDFAADRTAAGWPESTD